MTNKTAPFPDSDSPLTAFLEHSPAVAWIKDDQGRHIYFSQPYLEQIGVPAGNWYGKTDFDLWPAAIAERFLHDDQRVLTTGEVLKFEDRENVTFKNGADRTWWVVKFPINVAGSRYVGGIAIDINDQRQAEAERNELEREIANIASREQSRLGQELHDGFGQELIGLQLFASSLLEQLSVSSAAGEISEQATQAMQPLIERLANGLREANENIRALSHGLLPVPIEGEGLVSAINELVRKTNQLEKLHCRLNACDHLEFDSAETPTHLYRIAQEAISNAVKHSQADSIIVSLANRRGEILLTVNDNGCGMRGSINADDLNWREMGFGVRIMRYRAELIGGRLSIRSSCPGGTSVTCKLSSNVQP